MIPGVTHSVHVQNGDGEIKKYLNVLDVMVLPSGEAKFEHEGDVKTFDGGSIIRTRVNGLDDMAQYVCQSCEADASSVVTGTDFGGEIPALECPECGDSGYQKA